MTREQWLVERQKGIGASDASAIVGMNPYKSNVELWEEKIGEREPADISDKPYVQYGIEAEAPLRQLFALDYPVFEVIYAEFDMRWSKEYPFIYATLDGELIHRQTGEHGVYEGKTTEILKSQQYENWKNQVPPNYYCQLLHGLIATGYSFSALNAQLKTVYPEDDPDMPPEVRTATRRYFYLRKHIEDDIAYLLAKEIEFWKCVKDRLRPNLILPPI